MTNKQQSLLDIARGATFLTLTAVVLPVVLFSQVISLVVPGVPGA